MGLHCRLRNRVLSSSIEAPAMHYSSAPTISAHELVAWNAMSQIVFAGAPCDSGDHLVFYAREVTLRTVVTNCCDCKVVGASRKTINYNGSIEGAYRQHRLQTARGWTRVISFCHMD